MLGVGIGLLGVCIMLFSTLSNGFAQLIIMMAGIFFLMIGIAGIIFTLIEEV